MNKTKEKKVAPLILEDVVYFKKEDNGRVKSLGKESFYYTFLMQHKNDPKDGAKNFKAANDFVKYEDLYSYLVELGIIGNPKYTLAYYPIGEFGANFTLNLTEAMSDYDLEKILNSRFPNSKDYISTMLYPHSKLICSKCGAVTLSRLIRYEEQGESKTDCIACYPIEPYKLKDAQAILKHTGNTELSVRKRIDIVNSLCFGVAADCTIGELIDDYKESQAVPFENPVVAEIRTILDDINEIRFDVFDSIDFGIILYDRCALLVDSLFHQVATLNSERNEILRLVENGKSVFFGDNAIEFVKNLVRKDNQ